MADPKVPFVRVTTERATITSSVRSVSVEDNDRLIDKATVVIDDPAGASADVPKEGNTVTVAMGWGDQHTVLFQGIVVRVAPETPGNGPPRVTIVAFDPSWKMMQANGSDLTAPLHNPKTRQLPGGGGSAKLSDIVRQVVAPYDIPVGIIRCDPDPSLSRPLNQVNRTDWEFIQDLAFDYGARAYVEYDERAARNQFYFQPDNTLLQGDPMGMLHCCRGFSQLIEFKYDRVASRAAAQRVTATIDPTTGETIVIEPSSGVAADPAVTANVDALAQLRRVSPERADAVARAQQNAIASEAKPSDQRPTATLAGVPSDPDLPSKFRQDPTRILGFLGHGTCVGTTALRAKGKVTITGIASWAEGDWYVHKVTHTFTRVLENVRDVRNHSTYYSRFVVTR